MALLVTIAAASGFEGCGEFDRGGGQGGEAADDGVVGPERPQYRACPSTIPHSMWVANNPAYLLRAFIEATGGG
ncbi:hypothetical protein ACN261_08175 [Micromonospora sp. WMMD723]|uniref:hypothetical protein n=1 Tax=Micromonospora sp. WMMD723 TaxID=3403465 RepID=UPI003CE8C4B2